MNWDIDKEMKCRHCKATGYKVIFWLCCEAAESRFVHLSAANYLRGPRLVIPSSMRSLVEEVDWLSLKEVK